MNRIFEITYKAHGGDMVVLVLAKDIVEAAQAFQSWAKKEYDEVGASNPSKIETRDFLVEDKESKSVNMSSSETLLDVA